MDLGIKGKRALVVGGGKGIGRGIAEALAREGVDVALMSRNPANLELAAKDLASHGVRTMAVSADVGERTATDAGVARIMDEFGGVDILINNSGGPPAMTVGEVKDDLWTQHFGSMVLSIIHLTNLILPGMRQRKWGRIMTVASSGVIQPIRGLAISNVLRPALVGWSKTLATEVGRDGVTVNLLVPGGIRTQRVTEIWQAWATRSGRTVADHEAEAVSEVPVGRFGTIEEFGATAAFIASAHAGFITGSMIRIDGGMIRSV